MANSNNVYGTERSGQPSISDWVNQQEQANYNVRQEKLQQEQIEQHRKDKLLARDEKLRERLLSNLPKNTDTGSGSLTGFQASIVMKAVNRKGEIYNALRIGNISDSERVKLEIENANLDNLSSHLKTATGNFTKLIDDYKKGVEGGSFFQNADFEKKVLSGFDSYLGGIDENGFPLVGFKDIDGDGKIDLMPWDKLQEGMGVWEFQPKLNYDKVVSDAAKAMGTVENQDVNGFTTTTTKGIPIKNAQEMADSLINSADKSFINSRLRELGFDYKNPPLEAIEAIKKDITERIVMSKDQSSKKDVNQGAINSAARLAFDKQKDARDSAEKDQGKKDNSLFGEPVKPSTSIWREQHKNISPNILSVPVSGKIEISALEGLDKNGSEYTIPDARVLSYTYSKKGELLLDVSYKDSEGYDAKIIKKRINGSAETESRLAKEAKVSVSDMRERAGFKSGGAKYNESSKSNNSEAAVGSKYN